MNARYVNMIDNTTQGNMVAGVVVLFNPNVSEFKKSLNTYLPFCDFLICIDNSDKTIENELDLEKVVYIPYGRNQGLAKALNDGCKVAINKGASILITFDQDTFFEADCIPKLIDYVRRNKQSVASPNIKRIVRDLSGAIVVENQPFFQEETMEVPWCITSGCAFSSDMFISAGGFDDRLFIGQIDQDFSCRVQSVLGKSLT